MSCNIAVAVAGEGVVYPCAVGTSVGWAKEHIRDNITGGSVLSDGVGADEGDLIEVGKIYTFFGGSIPGKKYHLLVTEYPRSEEENKLKTTKIILFRQGPRKLPFVKNFLMLNLSIPHHFLPTYFYYVVEAPPVDYSVRSFSKIIFCISRDFSS